MASRALVRVAKTPDDYVKVYSRVLSEADQPVILHWLGDMFDPALKGYWGAEDFGQTLETALAVINTNASKVDGIKISLLDDQKEVVMRRRLPPSVKMYTGDDFNYPGLIAGDEKGHSHALLGIFDAIAPQLRRPCPLSPQMTAPTTTDLWRRQFRLPPYFPRSHPVLQNGHCVPRLAQWPPGSLHHGQWRTGHAPPALFH